MTVTYTRTLLSAVKRTARLLQEWLLFDDASRLLCCDFRYFLRKYCVKIRRSTPLNTAATTNGARSEQRCFIRGSAATMPRDGATTWRRRVATDSRFPTQYLSLL